MNLINIRAIGGAYTPEDDEDVYCYGCGEPIPPYKVEACTHIPPDYMPEDFRKRATLILCTQCTPEE